MWSGCHKDTCSDTLENLIIASRKGTAIKPWSGICWIITSRYVCESSIPTAGEAARTRYIPTITIHNPKVLVESTNPQRRPRKSSRVELACRHLIMLSIRITDYTTTKVTGQAGCCFSWRFKNQFEIVWKQSLFLLSTSCTSSIAATRCDELSAV